MGPGRRDTRGPRTAGVFSGGHLSPTGRVVSGDFADEVNLVSVKLRSGVVLGWGLAPLVVDISRALQELDSEQGLSFLVAEQEFNGRAAIFRSRDRS